MLNQDQILAAIITKNPEASVLDNSEVVFSLPTANNDVLRNTKITISAADGSPFSGSVEVFYHRINLSELGDIDVQSATIFTPANIVASINAQFNTELTLADIETFTIPSMKIEGDVSEITITAKTNALGWLGSTDIFLGLNIPPNMNAFNEFVSEILPANGYLI